ncbi:MAG: hypothetical protein MUC95_02245 [Spirochaetes bacterium]|nr:hypothetical protein [Spirochaetota bacterium]
MVKGIRSFLTLSLFILLLAPIYAEDDPQKEFNELYQPMSVVQRLSYDNFKNIKLLHAAIMNYGGGEAEFDKLVDTYALASALFFQNKIIESANLFSKNEKEIQEVSRKIAAIYKNEVDQLHVDIIKMNVKYKIKSSLQGLKVNESADKAVSGASEGLQKATDLYERSRPVEAIYYFRRAKEQCFKIYTVYEVPLPEKFKKDQVDNQNKVFEAKNKQI